MNKKQLVAKLAGSLNQSKADAESVLLILLPTLF